TGVQTCALPIYLARVLDRLRDLLLLFDAHAGDPARTDLAAVGDELAQHGGILVVDVVDLGRLERVDLLARLTHWWTGHRGAPLGFSEPGPCRRGDPRPELRVGLD